MCADFEAGVKKWLPHLILLVVVVVVFMMIRKSQTRQIRTDGTLPSADGNGTLYALGRGCEEDDVNTLLQRTYWAAYLHKRTPNWERVFVMVLLAIIILMALVWKKVASVPKILMTGFVIFLSVYMVDTFLYVHGDMYNDAYIRTNVKLMATKLGRDVDFTSDLPAPTCEAPDRVAVMDL
jgi:hypothetical protein